MKYTQRYTLGMQIANCVKTVVFKLIFIRLRCKTTKKSIMINIVPSRKFQIWMDSEYPSIHPFINTHKAAVIIKYKNTQSTMNRKIYKRNKIKMNGRVLPVIKAVQIEHTTNE